MLKHFIMSHDLFMTLTSLRVIQYVMVCTQKKRKSVKFNLKTMKDLKKSHPKKKKRRKKISYKHIKPCSGRETKQEN